MQNNDRDLVIMRHIFQIYGPKENHTWELTSTMVGSGQSKS